MNKLILTAIGVGLIATPALVSAEPHYAPPPVFSGYGYAPGHGAYPSYGYGAYPSYGYGAHPSYGYRPHAAYSGYGYRSPFVFGVSNRYVRHMRRDRRHRMYRRRH